jgi:hypothetical protein
MKSMFKGALGALMAVLALSGLTAASALASGAPIAQTKPATIITGTAAYLNGVVNPNGVETKDYFEYGPTASYGSKSREQTTTVEKTPSIHVEGLLPHSTYHFRMVATNSYGTSYGADEVFSTPVEKPELVVPNGKITELALKARGGSAEVEFHSQASFLCSSSEFSGQFINSKELEGKMRWSECVGSSGGSRYECLNEKEEKGGYINSWVQSEELKGRLGYVNSAKKEVGFVLSGKSSEIWAKKVNCRGSTNSLNGALGGLLKLPVNTKIHAGGSFSIVYTAEQDKQVTGELGGQLLWPESSDPFNFEGSLEGSANKEFEIQA